MTHTYNHAHTHLHTHWARFLGRPSHAPTQVLAGRARAGEVSTVVHDTVGCSSIDRRENLRAKIDSGSGGGAARREGERRRPQAPA